MSQKLTAYSDFQVPFTISKDGFYFVMADIPKESGDEDEEVILKLPKNIYARYFDSCCEILASLHEIPFDPDDRGIAFAVFAGLVDTGATMLMYPFADDEDWDDDESDKQDFRVIEWSADSSYTIEIEDV